MKEKLSGYPIMTTIISYQQNNSAIHSNTTTGMQSNVIMWVGAGETITYFSILSIETDHPANLGYTNRERSRDGDKHVWIFPGEFTCLRTYVPVCLVQCVYIWTYARTYMHIHTYMYTYTYIHTHVHTCTYTRVCTHIHTYIHIHAIWVYDKTVSTFLHYNIYSHKSAYCFSPLINSHGIGVVLINSPDYWSGSI